MWVIFEGLDKAGKTTLEWEFLKATNFKHVIIDRGPAGYVAFDILFDRCSASGNFNFARNLELMATFPYDFLVVYCKVPKDIAMQRLKEHNEECPYDYEYAQTIYDRAIKNLYEKEGIKVLTVDTTKSIEECVNFILGGLK